MIVDVALVVLSLLPLGWTGYLAVLALLSWKNRAPAPEDPPTTRFDIVVPAHD